MAIANRHVVPLVSTLEQKRSLRGFDLRRETHATRHRSLLGIRQRGGGVGTRLPEVDAG